MHDPRLAPLFGLGQRRAPAVATQVPKGLPVTAAFDRTGADAARRSVQLRLTVRNHGQEPVRFRSSTGWSPPPRTAP
jgi:hypothetical protein